MENQFKIFKDRGDFASQMLDKYFKNSPNNIISDIGVGYGHMRAKIESINAIWQPFDYIKKIPETVIWDLNEPAPTNSEKAGIIVFLEVLEHLANPLLALQHISNHVEGEGYLILTTPNPQSSKNRINLLIRGSLYAFQEKHLKEHHVFTPWEHIVSHFLNTVGFEIIEYAIVDTDYSYEKPKNIKQLIKSKIEGIIELKYPKSKGMSYGIVAKKNKI